MTSILLTIRLKYRYRRHFHVEQSKAVSTKLLRPFFNTLILILWTDLICIFQLSHHIKDKIKQPKINNKYVIILQSFCDVCRFVKFTINRRCRYCTLYDTSLNRVITIELLYDTSLNRLLKSCHYHRATVRRPYRLLNPWTLNVE